jgi:AAA15 family ATPase/GTPase
MKDLGQFNLIVGDNNVGKTSVLEALLACKPTWVFQKRLASLLQSKKIKSNVYYGDLELFYHKKDGVIPSWIQFKFTTKDEPWITIVVEFSKQNSAITITGGENDKVSNGFTDQISIDQKFISPFIPFSKGHDYDLTDFYPILQKSQSLKTSFIKSLRIILPNLTNIDMTLEKVGMNENISPYLIMNQSHLDYNLPLALFGDGTLKLFRILSWIILHKGERLMIDEVDAGIHFSRFREFWKVILNAAKENDVQLFMTTHSKECMQYFKEVLEEELNYLQPLVRGIALVENRETKQVTAHTYSFEELEHAINVGNEIRA